MGPGGTFLTQILSLEGGQPWRPDAVALGLATTSCSQGPHESSSETGAHLPCPASGEAAVLLKGRPRPGLQEGLGHQTGLQRPCGVWAGACPSATQNGILSAHSLLAKGPPCPDGAQLTWVRKAIFNHGPGQRKTPKVPEKTRKGAFLPSAPQPLPQALFSRGPRPPVHAPASPPWERCAPFAYLWTLVTFTMTLVTPRSAHLYQVLPATGHL